MMPSLKRGNKALRLAAEARYLPKGLSINDCMAYFTGYTKTKIPEFTDREKFLDLAKKCIHYCNAVRDKDTLHLLYYSIMKRISLWRFNSEFRDIWSTWDVIALDLSGLYKDKMTLQVEDLSQVFLALISFIARKDEEVAKESEDTRFLNICAQPSTVMRPIRSEEEPVDKTWGEAKDTPNEMVYFNRGGGLYHFIDVIRKVSFGTKADNHSDFGLYVSPSLESLVNAERDKFYARRPEGARAYGDIPSFQSGKIANKSLYAENDNAHEAFIKTADLLNPMTLKQISFFPVDKTMLHYFSVGALETIKKYSPDESKLDPFESRLTMVGSVLNARDFGKEVGEEEKLKEMYASLFKAP